VVVRKKNAASGNWRSRPDKKWGGGGPGTVIGDAVRPLEKKNYVKKFHDSRQKTTISFRQQPHTAAVEGELGVASEKVDNQNVTQAPRGIGSPRKRGHGRTGSKRWLPTMEFKSLAKQGENRIRKKRYGEQTQVARTGLGDPAGGTLQRGGVESGYQFLKDTAFV